MSPSPSLRSESGWLGPAPLIGRIRTMCIGILGAGKIGATAGRLAAAAAKPSRAPGALQAES